LPAGSTTLSVGNSLRLGYFGTKNLTDDSLVTKADVLSLVGASSRLVYSFRVRLGDVPFSSGTAGVINTFTVDSTNFPLN
jgi:hypothetical protein